jgi:hypothetical protein
MITRFATLSSRLAAMLTFVFTLVACGGGGGSGGFIPDNEEESGYYIGMILLDLLGEPTNTVTSTRPARLEVTVRKNGPNGAPIPDVVVQATSDVVVITPELGTGLTDENGVATFRVESGGALGAGSIVATVQNAPAATEPGNFNVQVVKAALTIGSFDNTNEFMEGVIDAIPRDDELSPGGTGTLTVAIVNDFGNLADTQENVLFTSDCLARGLATLSANPAPILGQGTVTYTAAGCEGEDVITASLLDTPSQATGSLTVAPLSSTAGKIVFTEADPAVIVIKGTGDGQQRKEQSQVAFTITDENDVPVPGVAVSFQLSTLEGGLSLTSATDVSDGSGEVHAEVNAGTIPTNFVVFATIDAAGISTSSELLAVSTGVPDQNGISLTLEGSNVIENGANVAGVERRLTVRLRDRFGTPALDGTLAEFVAEYGDVDASCSVGSSNGVRIGGVPLAGECTVLWTSDGEPGLPMDVSVVKTVDNADCASYTGGRGPCPDDLGAARGGRATITVTAEGGENTDDTNGDIFYSQGEPFENLSEAPNDHNEDGGYTPVEGPQCEDPPTSESDCIAAGADETYKDRNNNGMFDLNDSPAIYNGLFCRPEDDGDFCSRELVSIRDEVVLILSDANSWSFALVDPTVKRKENATKWGEVYKVHIADQYNNPPPQGSTVNVSVTQDCVLESPANFSVPNISAPGAFSIDVETDGEGSNGKVNINFQSSDGSSAQQSYDCIVRVPPDPNDRL